MIDLLSVGLIAGFVAVGAAALAAGNRIADEEEGYAQRMFLLFRARREQYNTLGWRALIMARALGLMTMAVIFAQVILVLTSHGPGGK